MKMNSYELSRLWFDFAFNNPSKITPAHGILYFFCIEHCNRLGWKKEFGLPTTMAKEAIGIRSYNTYINTLNDLVEWGFIILIEKSKNQYSSNIIALSNFNKAHDKALDKAMLMHMTKQSESTIQSISSIDKQINNITTNKEQEREESTHETFKPTVIFTSPEIENQEQRKVAPKESNYVIYPIEEIEQRFKNWEYELWEGAMKAHGITKEEYEKGVDMFLFEQGDERLKRNYDDIKNHLKSWIKKNLDHIKIKKNEQKFAGVSSSTIEQTFNAFKKKQPTAEN